MSLQKYIGQVLKKSNIVFNEEKHEYWDGERQLFGITSLINDRLYNGKKYENVPDFILERARAVGSLVHKEFEDYYKNGISGFTAELENFIEQQNQVGFKVVENEFTVDYKDRATNIDLILNWNGLVLCDIKTTASLDIDYLKWQLSLNAFMFENQTGIEVNRLFAYWTRTNELIEIERISNEEVKKFLDDDYLPKPIQVVKQKNINLIDEKKQRIFRQIQVEIQNQKALLEQLEQKQEQMRSEILKAMKENGVKSFDMGNIKITYVAPTTRESLDNKTLKVELPEIYEKYKKETQVKEQLKITIRSEK